MPKYFLFLAWQEKRKAFFEWKSINLSYVMNYPFILHVGLMLTIIKVFIILFFARTGNILAIFNISKLCFQLSVQVYSLLIFLPLPFFLLGFWTSHQIVKKGGLIGAEICEEVAGKVGVTFLRGIKIFTKKKKKNLNLKSLTTKVYKQKYFSQS